MPRRKQPGTKRQTPCEGDLVEFPNRKGPARGTVTKVYWKNEVRKRKMLRRMGVRTDDVPFGELETLCLEIAAGDGRGYYRGVPARIAKVIGNGNKTEAITQVRATKHQRADVQDEKRHANWEAVRERGLDNLKKGDNIEVRVRNHGWVTVPFYGFVLSSYKIRYTQQGKTRTAHPQNVRLVTTKGV